MCGGDHCENADCDDDDGETSNRGCNNKTNGAIADEAMLRFSYKNNFF
jgi:hypothetical protein